MSENLDIYDVIIIGAGLSGLCAAKHIREKCKNVSIKLLEQSEAAGGLLDGFKSRWITSQNFHATELCRELGVTLVELGQTVSSQQDGTRHVTPFKGFVFGRLAKIESDRLMAEIDALCSSRFVIEDPMNMNAFLERKLLMEVSKEFFRFLIKISCGFYPEELTVTDWQKFCRSLSSMRNAYEMLAYSETHLVPVGGWSELVTKLVETVGVENIAFSHKITRLKSTEEDIVLVSDEKGHSLRARTVICAVSCNDLVQIHFVPSSERFKVPSMNANITHVTNFRIQYQSCLWRNHGFSGSIFLPPYRIICFERNDKTLEGSFFHTANLSYHETRCAILSILSLKMRCRTLLYPLNFESVRQDLPFHFEVPPTFARRIIFSSSNASCWFRGYINGSVQAGIKAAVLVLLEVRPQAVRYKDVTDMQCLHFKYFPQRTSFEQFWYSVNLSSVGRLVAAIGTIAASFLMVLGLARNLSGLDAIESE
ncbi:amine oxidase [flavin-containing] A [Topomyia yanbarensis]|uniref:amine oxidase [flavin-containing] A n=1 Tax=Topomyia yanbarensis TaxID=2498891 RepID=UPI00273AE423|nr:amine oxidase [flavin-containing] A [Topomyia yanbarensis]